MNFVSAISLAALSAFNVFASPFVALADYYPSRQVILYVPYAPGGITDVLGRIIAQKLTNALGKPFVVENRPGGGTVVATLALTHAAADGYTLMMAPNGTLAMNPSLYKSLPYDLKELKPIALVGSLPFVLLVNPALPVKTVQDLIGLAKEKPGQLNYGSGGAGTSGDVFMKLFESISKFKMVHVAYRGSAPQLMATIADQVQVGFVDANSAREMVRSGKLRALAVSSAKRLSGLPNVPTMQEAGVPGFDADSWQMLIAPAATPKSIVELLNAEVNAITQSAAVKGQFVTLGVAPGNGQNIAQLEEFMKSEVARWGTVIRQAGLAGTL